MLAECFRSIDDFSLLQLKIFLNLFFYFFFSRFISASRTFSRSN